MPDSHKILSDILTDVSRKYETQLDEDLEELSENELESLHSDIIDVKSSYVDILEGKINRAQTLFNHILLIVAALITSISFLIQAELIQPKIIINKIEITIASSFLFTSAIFSMMTHIPVTWTKREFKSIYETGGKIKQDKLKMIEKIDEEANILEDLRNEIKVRDLFYIGSIISLMGTILILSYAVIDSLFTPLELISFMIPFLMISLPIIYKAKKLS